jgi:hypothetical protein
MTNPSKSALIIVEHINDWPTQLAVPTANSEIENGRYSNRQL